MSCKHGWFYCPECFDCDGHARTEQGARATLERLRAKGVEASMHESGGWWFVVTPRGKP